MTDSSKVPGGALSFWLGVLVTAGLVTALVSAWPDDEGRALAATGPLTPTTWSFGFPVPEIPEIPDLPTVRPGADAQLFTTGLPEAVATLLSINGQPQELEEIAVYPSYVFVTFRQGEQLVEARYGASAGIPRTEVGEVELADLFRPDEVDLTRIPALVQDAPSHYPMAVTVTHVLIDRFLPFDERVLVRVYASPPDDPAGGGYVSYTTDGAFVDVCC